MIKFLNQTDGTNQNEQFWLVFSIPAAQVQFVLFFSIAQRISTGYGKSLILFIMSFKVYVGEMKKYNLIRLKLVFIYT